MKKLIALILILNSLLFSDIVIVHGLSENYNSFLSLRSVPNGREVGKLHNGDRVKLIDKKGNWYKIVDLKSNKIGWAFKKHIKPINKYQNKYLMGKVHGLSENYNSFLSLRSVPNGREVGKLHNGDRVKLIDKKGNWYKVVDLKSQKIGWAFKKYLYRINNTSDKYNIKANINNTTLIQINNIQINDF